MAEFHLLALPGECRAAVVERGRLVELHLCRDGDGLAAGQRVEARLKTRLGRRGIAVAAAAGEEILLEPWPTGATEGASRIVEITRAAWREPGRDRLAKARPATGAATPPASLEAQLRARGLTPAAGWPDDIGDAFDEAFDDARLGRFRFEGGQLSLTPTPAFLAVDVDGAGDDLAVPALRALAAAIRLYGLGGNIVVDLPAMRDRPQRLAAAAAFDASMGALPFERTAVNGFGLLQIVRPRPGPSVLERARLDAAGTMAIELLRRAALDPGTTPAILDGPPAALGWIALRPHLVAELAQARHRSFSLPGNLHAEPTEPA